MCKLNSRLWSHYFQIVWSGESYNSNGSTLPIERINVEHTLLLGTHFLPVEIMACVLNKHASMEVWLCNYSPPSTPLPHADPQVLSEYHFSQTCQLSLTACETQTFTHHLTLSCLQQQISHISSWPGLNLWVKTRNTARVIPQPRGYLLACLCKYVCVPMSACSGVTTE